MTCIIIFEYKIYQQKRKVFCFSRKLDSLRNTFIVSNVYNLQSEQVLKMPGWSICSSVGSCTDIQNGGAELCRDVEVYRRVFDVVHL